MAAVPASVDDQGCTVSIHSFVIVALMAFVLLAPTLMVAVLVSGLSRRAVVETVDH